MFQQLWIAKPAAWTSDSDRETCNAAGPGGYADVSRSGPLKGNIAGTALRTGARLVSPSLL